MIYHCVNLDIKTAQPCDKSEAEVNVQKIYYKETEEHNIKKRRIIQLLYSQVNEVLV